MDPEDVIVYAIYPPMIVPYVTNPNQTNVPPAPPVLPIFYIPPLPMHPTPCPGQPVQHPGQPIHYTMPPIQFGQPTAQVVPQPTASYDDGPRTDVDSPEEDTTIQEVSSEPTPTSQDAGTSEEASSSEPPEAAETSDAEAAAALSKTVTTWTCFVCYSKFPTRASLIKHKKDVHVADDSRRNQSRGYVMANRLQQTIIHGTPNPCRLCWKIYDRRYLLDAHLRKYHRVGIDNPYMFHRMFH